MLWYFIQVRAKDLPGMGDYRRLRAWQEAMSLVVEVYPATSGMPKDERFGLTSQIRRAAVSIAANLAEGSGRTGDRELRRFVSIARGSAQELICELEVADALRMLTHDELREPLARARLVARLLTGLHKALGAERQPLS